MDPEGWEERAAELAELARSAGRRAAAGDWGPALVLLAELEYLATTTLHRAVAEARADGWSWPMVARSLNVTQQAAWSRFSRSQRRAGGSGAGQDR